MTVMVRSGDMDQMTLVISDMDRLDEIVIKFNSTGQVSREDFYWMYIDVKAFKVFGKYYETFVTDYGQQLSAEKQRAERALAERDEIAKLFARLQGELRDWARSLGINVGDVTPGWGCIVCIAKVAEKET